MQRTLFISFVLVLPATQASAQDTPVSYDGKWSAHVQGSDGKRFPAKVVIADFAGSWHDSARKGPGTDKACIGKKFPITVQSSTESELSFTVWGSSISRACPNLTVELKPVAANALEGTIVDLGTVRLTRP